MNTAPPTTISSTVWDTIVDQFEDTTDQVFGDVEDRLRLGLDWVSERWRRRAARRLCRRLAAARDLARTQVRRGRVAPSCVPRPRLLLAWAAAAEAMAAIHDAAWPGHRPRPDRCTPAEALGNEARLLRTMAEVARIRTEWEPGQDVPDRARVDDEIEDAAAELLDTLRQPCTPYLEFRTCLDELRAHLRPLLGDAVGVLDVLHPLA